MSLSTFMKGMYRAVHVGLVCQVALAVVTPVCVYKGPDCPYCTVLIGQCPMTNYWSSDIVQPNFENVRPISHYDHTCPNMMSKQI